MKTVSWQWAKANPDAAARRIRDLERQNAALRAEKEILDWLEAHAISIWVPHGDDQFAIILPTREAIQQARKEGQS